MATVDAIIDRTIALGDSKAAQSEAYGGQAFNAATGAAVIKAPIIDNTPSIREPGVSIPSRADGLDTSVFDSTYDRIIEDLSDRFADFILDYFPLSKSLMTSAEAWLQSAINGGTGLNPTIERQIWQRDRDRIGAEFSAESEAAIAVWAARGYPMPPGAAVGSLQDIARRRSAAIAASSRDAAIKAFETEIETVKFAVKATLDYRVQAISAAGDYLRALAIAPQIASQLTTDSSGAQARLISAAASFYNARIGAAQLAQQKNIAEAEMELKASTDSATVALQYVEAKVNAAVNTMQSLGQQASAALNAVNATVQKIVSE